MHSAQTFLLGYLVNALWQAPLLFAAAWALDRPIRHVSLVTAHRLWIACLLLSVAAPACSTGLLRSFLAAPATGSTAGVTAAVAGAAAHSSGLSLPPVLAAIVLLAWLGWWTFRAIRFAFGLLQLRRLRRTSHPAVLTTPQSECWRRALTQLPPRASTPELRIAEVPGPLTIGYRRPLVLLPSALLSQLSASQLAAVLAHECAHLARRDFLWNLVQQGIAWPISFLPTTTALLRRITETREMLCDSLAAAHAGGPRPYAQSLLRLASLLPVSGAPIPHTLGILDAAPFERRIMSLITLRRPASLLRNAAILAAAVTILGGITASAVVLHTGVQAEQPAAVPGAARISPGIMAGNILTRVAPVYPVEAKQQKIQGTVILHAIIGKDGTVANLQVLSGPSELYASALDAVRQWTYKPYLLNGDPVEVETTIQVTYSLTP